MRVMLHLLTSSCFLFPVGGGSKKFNDWGCGGVKKFRTRGGGYQFGGGGGINFVGWGWGVSTPLHAMLLFQNNKLVILEWIHLFMPH